MAYSAYASLTVDHTQCGGSDSPNFTVLVSLTDAHLALVAHSGLVQNTITRQSITVPADLVFSTDTGASSLLNWDVEQYNSTTGQIIAWVKVATLSHSTDTVFYISVGNAAVTTWQGGTQGTAYDSNTSAIYHLGNGSALNVNDWSTNAVNGTNNSATATAGQVDGGAALSGSSQYISLGNHLDPTNTAFTWGCWLKLANAAQFANILSKRLNSGGFEQCDFSVGIYSTTGVSSTAKQLSILAYDGGTFATSQNYKTTSNVIDGNAHRVWLVRPASGTPAIYVDGASVALTAVTANTAPPTTTNTANFNIGFDNGTTYLTATYVDEVQIVNANTRSADWITADYNNQKTSSTFVALGSWVTPGGASPNLRTLMGIGI